MKNDGGPAFPRPGTSNAYGPQDGMSLRDWFAGQALVSVVGQPPEILVLMKDGGTKKGHLTLEETLANAAYLLADAMLAERTKGK